MRSSLLVALVVAAVARPVAADRDPNATWSAGVEMRWVEKDGASHDVSIDLRYPRFRSRPKAIAKELNALFTAGAHPGTFSADVQGTYEYSCDVTLLSRRALSARCDQMTDVQDKVQGDLAEGAPAGPTPTIYTVWLQPGLPRIAIDELADRATAQKLIDDAVAASTCNLDLCPLTPDNFLIDTAGVTFVSTDYCERTCVEAADLTIPLEQLHPGSPWARKLLDWLRKRADAGDSAIVGEVDD